MEPMFGNYLLKMTKKAEKQQIVSLPHTKVSRQVTNFVRAEGEMRLLLLKCFEWTV